MVEKRGISFDDLTFERLDAAVGDDPLSPLVDRYCWRGLEQDAMLGRHGIHIDDPADRTEFVLDRLEEALAEWNA